MPRPQPPPEAYTLHRHSDTGYWYYYIWSDGRRIVRSTRETDREKAERRCRILLKRDQLIPPECLRWSEYARDWWTPEHDFCRRHAIGDHHMDVQQGYVRLHLTPFFKEKALEKITLDDCDRWVVWLLDKGLSNGTVNHCIATARVMFKEAIRRRLLRENVMQYVERLKDRPQPRGVLTLEEVRRLFASLDPWKGALIHYTAALLAACTGSRLGEIRALRGSDVYPTHVLIHRSRSGRYAETATKTGVPTAAPIPTYLYERLQELRVFNGDGYIFSRDDGATPLWERSIAYAFCAALRRIGISEEERKRRRISFHSWRHCFVTWMRAEGIPDAKVAAITRHAGAAMQAHYTHISLEHYADVMDVLSRLVTQNVGT